MMKCSPIFRTDTSPLPLAAIVCPLLRFLLLASVTTAVPSQHTLAQAIPEAWVQRYDPASEVLQEGNAVATDAIGDVAVTGARFIGNNEAWYTAKYARETGE